MRNVRVAVVGGGPEAAGIAYGLARECEGVDVMLVLNSMGEGVAFLGLPFTDKDNLESQEGTMKILSKALERAKPSQYKLVYALEEGRLVHAVKRIALTVWARAKRGVKSARVTEELPEEVGMPREGFSAPGYIVSEGILALRPGLLLSMIRSLRGVSSAVFASWFRAEIDEKVEGIATPEGYERVDALIAVCGSIHSTGVEMPRGLPRRWRVRVPLAPPRPHGAIVLAAPSLSVTLTGRGGWATLSLGEVGHAPRPLGALTMASEAIASRLPYLSGLRTWRAAVEETVVSPDFSPLAGRVEGWPEGFYAVASCGEACLSLAYGIALTLCEELRGGEGVYSFSRIEKKRLLREYLTLP